jgi:hypothetical protein
LGPGSETVTEVAATAPEVPVAPRTAAHRPTLSAADVAELVRVYAVDELVVTSLELAAPLEFFTDTVMVDPDTAVTSPVTGAVKAPLRGVDGRGDALGLVPLRGPKRKPPPVHVPFVAAEIETLVTAPEGEDEALDPAAGNADATMQDPTVTSLAVALAVCRMVVDADTFTAVCALWLCTCRVLPFTAAI